jgi:M6 family metalloprotease-like protein
MDIYGTEVFVGDQMIIHEALAYLEKIMDLSPFDSDGNGYIDSVVIINTLAINENVDMNWAYRYWNYYMDENENYYEFDGVCLNDYLWASYQFMYEGVDKNGNHTFTNTSSINTYTYIHEFAHVLGADDYYDTTYVDPPLDGHDVMDDMTGDHNAYTKFNYGWLTSSRLVVAEDTITLSLEDFSKNGDTIIIANNWDEDLGVYQEYYVLVYYRNTGLNGGGFGYFDKEGVVVYHVNASLYMTSVASETHYTIYNTNTDASNNTYGTEDNLIEFAKSNEGNFTYIQGDSLPPQTDDLGNKLSYSFTVDSLTEETATITFTKN